MAGKLPAILLLEKTMRQSNRQFLEPRSSWFHREFLLRNLSLLGAAVLFCVFVRESQMDFHKLTVGFPKVLSWIPSMFPPDVRGFGEVLSRAFETLAMATVGTLIALVVAFPLGFLGARNTTPHPVVYYLVRVLFNLSRGTETLVFALIFVAAIGFGPFTGVLAIAFHMMGAIGKMFAEVIEPAEKGPMEAVALTGASKIKVYRYALLPDVSPNLIAVTLYMWEYTVRTSTILGIVGAGGIGQMLKDTIDLLDFPKMITVLAVILAMVWLIDLLSDFLRRQILQSRNGESLPPPDRIAMEEVRHA